MCRESPNGWTKRESRAIQRQIVRTCHLDLHPPVGVLVVEGPDVVRVPVEADEAVAVAVGAAQLLVVHEADANGGRQGNWERN